MLKSEQNAIGFWALPKACWYLHTYTLFLAVLQDSKFQQTKLLLLNKFFCVNFPAHDQSQERYVLFGILLQPALQPASITTQVRSDSKSGWKKQLPKCWNLQHFSTYPAFYLHFCERVKPPKNGLPNKRRPTNPGALLAFLTSIIDIDPSIRSFHWCCFPRNSPSSQEVRYSMWRELFAWCVRVVGHSHYDCKSIWIIIIYVYIFIYLYITRNHSTMTISNIFIYICL